MNDIYYAGRGDTNQDRFNPNTRVSPVQYTQRDSNGTSSAFAASLQSSPSRRSAQAQAFQNWPTHPPVASTITLPPRGCDIRLSDQQSYQNHLIPPHRQARGSADSQVPAQHYVRPAENAVIDLLPYCTTEPPLSQDQVIALSDIAGSLKELALLTLGAAAGNIECTENLVNAVGRKTATNIVDFFTHEWEI